MKQCPIKAEGCEGEFEPKNYWQFICNNPECKKQRRNKKIKEWQSSHKEYHKEYMRKYNKL